MRADVMVVTPEMAARWLERNQSNRRVRSGVVKKYAAAMNRGEWELTHQGIAIDVDGNLVDGQHRLLAVVMSQLSIKMCVAFGVSPNTFGVLDQGAKRNLNDHFNDDKFVSQPVGFLGRIVFGMSNSTVLQLKSLKDVLEPWIREFAVASGTARKALSSAPVKAAAIMTIMRHGDADRVIGIYNALVTLDTQNPMLRTSGHALIRSCSLGQKNLDSRILFVKAMRMFHPVIGETSRTLLVHNADADIAEVRKSLLELLEKSHLQAA